MTRIKFQTHRLLTIALIALFAAAPVWAQKRESKIQSSNNMKTIADTVFLPTRSPLVSLRIQFLTGAVDDPDGKEGVANLTAALLAGGGSKQLTYDQIVERFYPMATGFGAQVDKEMTTFSGTTHVDNLEKYYGLVRQMLLEPGFREDDFARLKQNAINYLKTGLRQGNDEELGKERLYNVIYSEQQSLEPLRGGTKPEPGHRRYAAKSYAHHTVGTISSLEKLTLADVKNFYAENYTGANLVLGVSGGFSANFAEKMQSDFARLPAGEKLKRAVTAPRLAPGMKIDIVERETRATAISLGFPISVNRSHKDYPALALVASYFGQHRSSNSYLYGRLRELRGLNYGDYAYIEYFPRGMFQFEPDPNLARRQQIFQIWIRPVEPQNAHFALRAALYEHDKLVKNGMSAETFLATREFLSKYVNILTQTQSAALGYELDSRFYGVPDFNSYMKQQLAKLTLEEVNAAIKRHLSSNSMRVVMVTKDAAGLKNVIVSNAPSPITYNSPKAQEILNEDKIIQTYKINVRPEDVTITPVERVFE